MEWQIVLAVIGGLLAGYERFSKLRERKKKEAAKKVAKKAYKMLSKEAKKKLVNEDADNLLEAAEKAEAWLESVDWPEPPKGWK